jgi:hypothetical protein
MSMIAYDAKLKSKTEVNNEHSSIRMRALNTPNMKTDNSIPKM